MKLTLLLNNNLNFIFLKKDNHKYIIIYNKMTNVFIKYKFDLTAESFVSQPMVRKKSVLKTKIQMTDQIKSDDICDVLSNLENAVKEFQ